MRRLVGVAILTTVLFVFPALLSAQSLHMTEVDIGPTLCDNWQSFPYAPFTNNERVPIKIRAIRAKFASSQSLQGELAIWVTHNANTELIYSYGVSVFLPPSQTVQDTFTFPGYRELAPGDTWYVITNCGPVTGGPAGFYYVAGVQFWWE